MIHQRKASNESESGRVAILQGYPHSLGGISISRGRFAILQFFWASEQRSITQLSISWRASFPLLRGVFGECNPFIFCPLLCGCFLNGSSRVLFSVWNQSSRCDGGMFEVLFSFEIGVLLGCVHWIFFCFCLITAFQVAFGLETSSFYIHNFKNER